MTTATATMSTGTTATGDRRGRSLEELVDRMMDALFQEQPGTAATETATETVARSVHEARRLRQAGDLDAALALLAGADTKQATEREAHWAYSEWLDIAKRRLAGQGALLYRQGTGRAAALVPSDSSALEVAAVLGMRWRPGRGRLAAQPAGPPAPHEGRRVMVATASAPTDIAALKARHPLGDVVEASGVQLRGRGRVRQGVCPFHEEAEGSFTVYADSQRWYCFGCGEGGDVLDFLQRVEGLSLPEAIRRLDGGVGPAPTVVRPRRSTTPPVPPRDPALLTAAARYYCGQLHRSREGRAYLASRGIRFETALRLGLGYAPGRGLREALASAGFAAGRIRDSGLFMERGERFAGMVVVPETTGGRVRWLAGRAIDPQRSPRFQAPPGPKPVLGLGRLGPAPPWAVLTEGVFDWLVLAQWGLPACAALGTQGMERVAAALRGCPHVFLAFDADDAGREATGRMAGLLGRRAAIVTLPAEVADVAELATSAHGRATFLRLLERAARAAR